MILAADVRFPPSDMMLVEGLNKRIPGLRVRRSGSGGATFSIPDHALSLAWDILHREGWSTRFRDPGAVAQAGVLPDLRELALRILHRMEDEGILKPGVGDTFYDHQLDGFGFNCWRGNGHSWAACAGGKTRIGIGWGLSVGGTVVFVTRVALCIKVAREVAALTNCIPHIWLPPSRRRKAYVPTGDYYALHLDPLTGRLTKGAPPPFIVVGQENLVDALPDILVCNPTSVIFDEEHRLCSWKRWDAQMDVSDDEGEGRVTERGSFRTGRGGVNTRFELKENVAAAAYVLSRAAKRRLGLSATPIPDRVRNLWSPLDLVEPKGFGGFYDFASRYCGAHPGAFGGIDTTGATHQSELQSRLEWVAWNTPLEVVQASLPPLREDCVWLTPDNLQEPLGGWKRELKQAARFGGESVLEAHLAMTASRKRRWVVGQVHDALKAGQKVLVFTGRRRDAEDIADAVRSAVPEHGDKVVWTHGGHSPEAIQQAVDDYMNAEGCAFLSATWDSIGEGQDLQDTDLMLVVQLPWSPVKVTQIRGRVSRPGQKRPCLLRYVCAQNTVDERALAILAPKLTNVAGLLGDVAAGKTAEILRGVDDQDALLEELASLLAGGDINWNEDEDE